MSDDLNRRNFLKGAAGAVSLTLVGADALVDARVARAQNRPLRVLTPEEAATFEAVGDTLLPGARAAGIAHFVDQQLSRPPEEALLEARILNVRPPFADFYRSALAAIDRAARTSGQAPFTALSASQQHDLIDQIRQARAAAWQGPPAPLVYAVMRADAVDVVYGTVEGYRSLGIPYMAHIPPKQQW
jgi:hypothetical protein